MGIATEVKKTETREAHTIRFTAKCTDRFSGTIIDKDGERIGERQEESYVPDFFPGEHYGDYVQLEIELETGRILNWTPPTGEQLAGYIAGFED